MSDPQTEYEADAYRTITERLDELLNPADDDVADVAIWLGELEAVIAFVAAQPCSCAPNAGPASGWDVEPCERCKVLGRANDERYDR